MIYVIKQPERRSKCYGKTQDEGQSNAKYFYQVVLFLFQSIHLTFHLEYNKTLSILLVFRFTKILSLNFIVQKSLNCTATEALGFCGNLYYYVALGAGVGAGSLSLWRIMF